MTNTADATPTGRELTAAVRKLNEAGIGEISLIHILEMVRDGWDVRHVTAEFTGACVEDCEGCLAARIAYAVTRTVNSETR